MVWPLLNQYLINKGIPASMASEASLLITLWFIGLSLFVSAVEFMFVLSMRPIPRKTPPIVVKFIMWILRNIGTLRKGYILASKKNLR